MAKITLEQAKLEFINRGYEPLFTEYINCETKLLAQTKEGYKIITTLSNLKSGKNPKIIIKNNPYTIYNIKLWLKLNKNSYILKSKEYIGTKEKLLLTCNKHGDFEISWNDLNKGRGCYKCGRERISNFQRKYTIDEISKLFKNKNYKLLSEKYITNKHKLKYICLKHNERIQEISLDNFLRGRGCYYCGRERTESAEHIGLKGSDNPMWKGGITPLHNYLRDKIYPWKKDSFEKYKYKCDITGKHKNIIIHHNYNFSKILQETMEILNLPIYKKVNKYTDEQIKSITDLCLKLHYKYGLGMCLCEEEHNLFHSIYGKENNTIKQYEEFKKIRLSQKI